MTVTRAVPYDLAAEASVLGSLLIDRDAIIEVAPFLKAGDFYRETNGAIYSAILKLYEAREPADNVLVMGELKRMGWADTIRDSDLIKMATDVPTSAHVVYYAKRVEATALLRRVIQVGGQIAAEGYSDPDNVGDVLAKAEELLNSITANRSRGTISTMEEMISEWHDRMDRLRENPNEGVGVQSGFLDLDHLTGGWQRAQLVIQAARPSVGKTAFMLNQAMYAAKHGHRVGIFSIEMGREELIERMISLEAQIDSRKLRRGDKLTEGDWSRITQADGVLATLPIFIDDSPSVSISDVATTATRMQHRHQIDILFVDYLQYIDAPRKDGSRTQEVAEIARKLKKLARSLNIPVVTLAQLSRQVDERKSHIPQLSDLGESSELEKSANIVCFLHRPEVYEPTAANAGLLEIHVAKNRSGPSNRVIELRFISEYTQFQNLMRIVS